MKRFYIEWETDFCDNFSEISDSVVIEAENETEAIRKFRDMKIQKGCISRVIDITEEKKEGLAG